jgi:hypothetical protein
VASSAAGVADGWAAAAEAADVIARTLAPASATLMAFIFPSLGRLAFFVEAAAQARGVATVLGPG